MSRSILSGEKTEMLTHKEEQIYLTICRDGIFDSKELAKKFNISSTTLKRHLMNIYGKLCVSSRTELVYYYYTKGKDNV
ncbi:helix-turn-helix transcriptional regulator [bacterium]|nr:helix-turn-helix transcriptional regulator [bacterium]